MLWAMRVPGLKGDCFESNSAAKMWTECCGYSFYQQIHADILGDKDTACPHGLSFETWIESSDPSKSTQHVPSKTYVFPRMIPFLCASYQGF